MHRITAMILDISNAFQNKNAPIHERFCVSPPTYYLKWFQRSYPNVLINRYDGPFCLQYMNGIQGKKPAGRKWNRLLDAVFTILKYNKSTMYHDIYIKVVTGGTVLYLTVSADDGLNTTTNETYHFEIKVQEGSVLKYLNFRVCQSPLGFIVNQNDHIMELLN